MHSKQFLQYFAIWCFLVNNCHVGWQIFLFRNLVFIYIFLKSENESIASYQGNRSFKEVLLLLFFFFRRLTSVILWEMNGSPPCFRTQTFKWMKKARYVDTRRMQMLRRQGCGERWESRLWKLSRLNSLNLWTKLFALFLIDTINLRVHDSLCKRCKDLFNLFSP